MPRLCSKRSRSYPGEASRTWRIRHVVQCRLHPSLFAFRPSPSLPDIVEVVFSLGCELVRREAASHLGGQPTQVIEQHEERFSNEGQGVRWGENRKCDWTVK